MIYITEKERFYKKTLLGAKRLYCVQAYVWQTELEPSQDELATEKRIIGTLREYSVAGWKELMSRPDVWYRASAQQEFVAMAKWQGDL